MVLKVLSTPPIIGTKSSQKTKEYELAKTSIPKSVKLTFHDTNNNNQLSPKEWLEYTQTDGTRVVMYNPHVTDTPEIVAKRTNVPIETIKANWRFKPDSSKRDPNTFLTLTCNTQSKTTTTPLTLTKPDASQHKEPKPSVTAQKPFADNTTPGHADNFYNALAFKESSWNPSKKNGQHIGWFQMSQGALITTGYMRSNGTYTGKDGIFSKDNFLTNTTVQINAVKEYHKAIAREIKQHDLQNYLGKTIKGIKITESGMIAGAHLVGTGNLKQFLESNGKIVPKDANGTPITQYIRDYGNYNLPEISPLMQRKPDSELPEVHVLQEDESIATIASKYDRSVKYLLKLNGLNEKTAKKLQIGQKITLKTVKKETK